MSNVSFVRVTKKDLKTNSILNTDDKKKKKYLKYVLLANTLNKCI